MRIERITNLIEHRSNKLGEYILYWMQQSQRVNYNHALLHAINIANENNLPLLVCFVLNINYSEANVRHYKFMLEGIKEVRDELERRNISFVIKTGEVLDVVVPLLSNAHTVVMDYGYLKIPLKWRKDLYQYIRYNDIETNLVMVESDLLIPVNAAYFKAAYNAYIFRKSISNRIEQYRDFTELVAINNKSKINITSDINIEDVDKVLDKLFVSKEVEPSSLYIGGYSHAKDKLDDFLKNKIQYYDKRNDPSLFINSYLSMYLHFGQISVLEILDELDRVENIDLDNKAQFIDQLVIRRELAHNFVFYNKDYDNFNKIFEPWIYKTIYQHAGDKREKIYNLFDLENSLTHDIYYNAAMREMKNTGFMAGYMRMYWAKKIMEWSPSMKKAYEMILYLNNKYLIDGRDPNSYLNIAWCFGKTDRPWKERPIFGTIRYMNEEGLRRKFNIEEYVRRVNKGEYYVSSTERNLF